jgi:hypothetical protein
MEETTADQNLRTANSGTETKRRIHQEGNLKEMVPGGGFEPPTRGFSIRCSTN